MRRHGDGRAGWSPGPRGSSVPMGRAPPSSPRANRHRVNRGSRRPPRPDRCSARAPARFRSDRAPAETGRTPPSCSAAILEIVLAIVHGAALHAEILDEAGRGCPDGLSWRASSTRACCSMASVAGRSLGRFATSRIIPRSVRTSARPLIRPPLAAHGAPHRRTRSLHRAVHPPARLGVHRNRSARPAHRSALAAATDLDAHQQDEHAERDEQSGSDTADALLERGKAGFAAAGGAGGGFVHGRFSFRAQPWSPHLIAAHPGKGFKARSRRPPGTLWSGRGTPRFLP